MDVTVHRKKKVNDSRSMKIKEACWQPWRGEVEEVDEESMEEVSTVTHTVLSRPLNSINGSKHNINESEGSNMMAGGKMRGAFHSFGFIQHSGVHVVVQFYPWFKFVPPLFYANYHKLS